MEQYGRSIQDVFKQVKSSERGLSQAEAERRLAENGRNALQKGKKRSKLLLFFAQFADLMTVILILAAILSAVLAFVTGDRTELADTGILLFVILLNAIVGFLQQYRADAAIEKLKKLSACEAKAVRGGKVVKVDAETLVVGDVIELEEGDRIPADCRVLRSENFRCDESMLTGESKPAKKYDCIVTRTALAARANTAHFGTFCVKGNARCVVTACGMDTEMGKIASALSQAEEGKTPLQIKLSQLSRILTYLVVGICVVIFAVNLTGSLITNGSGNLPETILNTFMIAVSLAVAAIPEGLSTVVTIVLSIGVTNMSKKNAIIRKLTAVETLGCTQIICSDKTGTLTQNKMTVVDHVGEDEGLLANAMSLCSDAEFDAGEGAAVGEPTECALVNYAAKLGLDKNSEKQKLPRVGEIPFDSGRKMMTTVHRAQDGHYIQFTKGAPDEILKRCSTVLEGGTAVPLTDAGRERILAANKGMADRALRVLAVAQKQLSAPPAVYESDAVECDLCFVGLVGMIDPVRPEVKAAIEECRRAGIRPIMITGDHRDTAVAIAKELGIITDASQAITGADLDKISDEQFATDVQKYSVYARVQPEHKTRIVNAWRKLGKVTAMTGDGVNDAPSIKNADIGVGMGITGTDVTKNVADMILADDNFATIVSAAAEGRRIYDNIRKAIQFLLASNLSEVLTIFCATMIGIIIGEDFTVFLPVHLLWINLITDCFPALSLGLEKPEADVMQKAPRDPKEGVFAGGMGIAVAYQGVYMTVITLVSYCIGRYVLADMHHAAAIAAGEYSAQMLGYSMAFLTLSMGEIFHSFNMRSLHGSVFAIKSQNKWLWGAGALSLILTTAVIEIPFLAKAFSLAELNLPEYGIALALAVSVIPVVELCKLFYRLAQKKRAGN